MSCFTPSKSNQLTCAIIVYFPELSDIHDLALAYPEPSSIKWSSSGEWVARPGLSPTKGVQKPTWRRQLCTLQCGSSGRALNAGGTFTSYWTSYSSCSFKGLLKLPWSMVISAPLQSSRSVDSATETLVRQHRVISS